MSEKVYYLAYGSNLHPMRLQARCPSAKWLQSINLTGYKLTFDCVGNDDSGKGNLLKTDSAEDSAIAAVYQMDAAEKPILDEIEGEPYAIHYQKLQLDIGVTECFIYLAKDSHRNENILPFQWYQQLILLGAHYNLAEQSQLNFIRQHKTQIDSDKQRQQDNRQLLESIKRDLRNHKLI